MVTVANGDGVDSKIEDMEPENDIHVLADLYQQCVQTINYFN